MENTAQTITVPEIVIESFINARALLADIFGGYAEVNSFSKVLGALRMLDDEMLETIGRPVVVGMFEGMGLDPTTAEGRNGMEPFMDNLALAIQDAMTILMGQMQQSAAKRQALASGNAGLLRS